MQRRARAPFGRRAEHEIAERGLVLQRGERHAVRGRRALEDGQLPGHRHRPPRGEGGDRREWHDALRRQRRALGRHGVRRQGESRGPRFPGHPLGQGLRGQGHRAGRERQAGGGAPGRGERPEELPSGQAPAVAGAAGEERRHHVRGQAGPAAAAEGGEVGERPATRPFGDQGRAGRGGEATHIAQAEAHPARLQRAVVGTGDQIRPQDGDVVATGVADDDVWRVKAAGLGIEPRAVERDGMVRFQVGRLVGQPRERERVGARESVPREGGELPPDRASRRGVDATRHGPAHEAHAPGGQRVEGLEDRHRPGRRRGRVGRDGGFVAAISTTCLGSRARRTPLTA